MSIPAKVRALLRFHEGVEYKTYLDSEGLLTWGIGWCIQRLRANATQQAEIGNMLGIDPNDVPWDYPVALGRWLSNLSNANAIIVANYMLIAVVDALIPEVETKFGYWPDLGEARAAAVVDICYNMGIGVFGKSGFLEFVNTNTCMAAGMYAQAAKNLLDSDYHRKLLPHRPFPGFVLRSERIAKIIETGEWPDDIPEPKED